MGIFLFGQFYVFKYVTLNSFYTFTPAFCLEGPIYEKNFTADSMSVGYKCIHN